MKRSGDVTAAAIILFFGSGLLILFMLFAILGAELTPLPPEARYGQFIGLAFYLLFAAWGVATGVGILRLRSWARISIIAMSVLAIFSCMCAAVGFALMPAILEQLPDAPPRAAVKIMVAVGVIMLLIPLAIAIWWLILFTRKRLALEFASRGVRAQFRTGVTLNAGPPVASSAPPAFTPSGQTFGSPAMQLPNRRPVSITVIAVFLLAGAAFFPLILFYPANWRITALFGMVLTGRPVLALFAVCSALGVVLGVGLLRLKPWARVATILYAVVVTVNGAVSMRAMTRVFQMLQSVMGMPTFSEIQVQMMRRMMQLSMIGGVGFAVGLNVVAIYFLVTRRAAFYPPPPDSPSASIAPVQGMEGQ